MKKIFLILFVAVGFNSYCQIPTGYYNGTNNLSGNLLKTVLHNITTGHTNIVYPNMWPYFAKTDAKPNGKLWDIYSYNPNGAQPYEFIFGTNKCGTYNSEGDCYNREHTWPQTFFANAEPTLSDFHHVFPTDGWVNGKRNNFPYGNVVTANYTSQNGCKLGTTNSYTTFTQANTNHYVFEPIDSIKGDLARVYFYMNVRYTTEDAGWSNWEMANGAELTPAAITLLLAWHQLDPVSVKELNRNDSIYSIQRNRNPFVDHPEFVNCIWGVHNCGPDAITNKPTQKPTFTIIKNNLQLQNMSNTNFEYCIYNLQGSIIKKMKNADTNIDINDMTMGYYILKIIDQQQAYFLPFIK
jgi:endonuclease I